MSIFSTMSTAVTRSKKRVRVLVCSGNLGNAEPNLASLKAWVPEDGRCKDVLQNQKYPIVFQEDDLMTTKLDVENDNANNGGSRDTKQMTGEEESLKDKSQTGPENGESSQSEDDGQFDIIAMGMQESTFEPGNSVKLSQLIDDAVTKTGYDLLETPNSKRALERTKKVASKTGKAARKGVNVVNMATASKDHTVDAKETLVKDGTGVLHKLLEDRLPSYTRIMSFQRGEMRLIIFALEKGPSVKVLSVKAQNTGRAGLANKGGIVVTCGVGDNTRISFFSAHLEAHEGEQKYKSRCSMIADIFQGTKKQARPDCSLDSHFCFVMGDLNFRTRYLGQVAYEEQIEPVNQLVANKNWKELNAADELRMALNKKDCLVGFQTLFCNFPPTFKVERGEGFVYKQNRTPSYTDRILWKTGHMLQDSVHPLVYESVDGFTTSDHKPIRGAFEVMLNNPLLFSVKKRHNAMFHWRSAGQASGAESLHLFVGRLKMDIFRGSDDSDDHAPDPYVCLVSNPRKVLLWPPSMFQRIVRKMKEKCFCLCRSKQINKSFKKVGKSNGGPKWSDWPQTKEINSTLSPDWSGEDELHCILRTHHANGSPRNLGGAILHLVAFDGKNGFTIGYHSINLEDMFRQCKSSQAKSGMTVRSRHLCTSESDSDRLEDDAIASFDISGPLLKNGKETGVISCRLEAWWVDDAVAFASATAPIQTAPTTTYNRRSTHRRSNLVGR